MPGLPHRRAVELQVKSVTQKLVQKLLVLQRGVHPYSLLVLVVCSGGSFNLATAAAHSLHPPSYDLTSH